MPSLVLILARIMAILMLASAIGCSRPTATPSSRAQEEARLLLRAQADALGAKILLEELRAGRLTNAIELIEQNLDTQVLMIDRFRSSAGPVEAEKASATLRAVQEYRSMYPRKKEALIENTEHFDPVFDQAQERVRQILHDAKLVGVQPDSAANGSQPIRSETNHTSSAAGSRR